VPSNYWSSTTNAGNPNNAWHVNFNNGNDNNDNKSSAYYVRAVRGGKCSLLSFSSLYAAYLDCRKRKRGTLNALRFEYRLLVNLFQLAQEIQQGTYQPSRSVCFVTTKPKTREIFAADFRDRIVHHLVVRELEKIYEPKFIYDSYASRPDKGTHAAVRRLQKFMLQATRNRKISAWYLQLDIRSFFMSIDKNILFSLLVRRRVVGNLKAGLKASAVQIAETFPFHGKEVTRINVHSEAAMKLRQTLASYLGHLKHADTHHLLQALWARFPWLNLLFLRVGYHLYARFHYPGEFRTFRSQVCFLQFRLAGVPALFRVGKYYELYGRDAQEISKVCGLQLLPEKRGIQYCTGFPRQNLEWFLVRLFAAGREVAVVEQGDRGQYVHNRYVKELWAPRPLPALAQKPLSVH